MTTEQHQRLQEIRQWVAAGKFVPQVDQVFMLLLIDMKHLPPDPFDAEMLAKVEVMAHGVQHLNCTPSLTWCADRLLWAAALIRGLSAMVHEALEDSGYNAGVEEGRRLASK